MVVILSLLLYASIILYSQYEMIQLGSARSIEPIQNWNIKENSVVNLFFLFTYSTGDVYLIVIGQLQVRLNLILALTFNFSV